MGTGHSTSQQIAAHYLDYATRWFPGHSELYVRWANGVAASPVLLELLAPLPAAKTQPNLVFAAARFHGCGDNPFSVFEDHVVRHWPEIRAVVLSHVTQTNEAGRCATLLPLLSLVAEAEHRPLALIEVGASAGLCLLLELYSYSYDGAAPIGAGSPLLHCTTTGHPPLPTRVPEIAWRAGIDLNPLDGTERQTAKWLRALVWPGQHERLERLDAALKTLERLKSGSLGAVAGAPMIVAGDLNERIEELVASAPSHAVPVVFHSAVLAYLNAAERRRFAKTIKALGCRWISNEAFFMDGAKESKAGRDDDFFTVALDGVPLAKAGPHGARLDWL